MAVNDAIEVPTAIKVVPKASADFGCWLSPEIAIAGGVGGATLLSLYFVPSAYLLLMRPHPPGVESEVRPAM